MPDETPNRSVAAVSSDVPSLRNSGIKKRPSITSDELLKGSKELLILHAEDEYRLRLTSKGKLILTK